MKEKIEITPEELKEYIKKMRGPNPISKIIYMILYLLWAAIFILGSVLLLLWIIKTLTGLI